MGTGPVAATLARTAQRKASSLFAPTWRSTVSSCPGETRATSALVCCPPRVCRLAFHALGKYHHWLACWLHRRGAPWLHLARHHRVCTCHHLPLGPDVPAQGLRPSCASHARRLHCSRL